ncbi:hypothetical protein WA026_003246 [Henosepilachna vigintioctopunctata]|uniref:Uncharacterized protein n=1 Tax=Henosepilachna vigintioctopunctata TaxID=420089 RepID=A0AAW1TND5_9CUCU
MSAVMDKLVLVVCISAIVTARTVRSPEETQQQHVPNYFPQHESYVPTTNQQLPSVEVPKIPFNVPAPSSELKPPQYYENPAVSFVEVPVPSSELRAPSEALWNPNNDPIYYYEVPASLTKLETPTKKFPKKYNKDIHAKGKALSSQPKIEIELVPIEEKELIYKENTLQKKYDSLAKVQNQKELENLKVQQTVQI